MSIRRFAARLCGSLLLGLTSGASAAPCAGFTDVQDTSGFCIHIEWLRNRAITLGCTANQYCPADFVRRDQMAAFLYRLGVQNAFLQGGNAFGTTAALGTLDNKPLHLHVNGAAVLQIMPATSPISGPNLVGGHPNNRAEVTCAGICVPTPHPPNGATIGGGGSSANPNRVTDSVGTVGGGSGNRAGNDDADASDATFATVAGGLQNVASGLGSTVGGGYANIASGLHATVPGGVDNEAGGRYSFAAGRRAKAPNEGCFVWADTTDSDIACGFANQFVARATGGFWFYSQYSPNPAVGARLLPGATSWSMLSDRALKENVEPVDAEAVLDGIVAMPIATWNLVTQAPSIRHMGPMAQEFHAAFQLGEDERLISTVDAQGVALAAIQGLAARDRAHARAIEALEARNASLESALRELAAEVRALKTSSRVE